MRWAECYLQKHQVLFIPYKNLCCSGLELLLNSPPCKERLLKMNNQQQRWGGEEGLPQGVRGAAKAGGRGMKSGCPKALGMRKESTASHTNPPMLLQATTQKLLTNRSLTLPQPSYSSTQIHNPSSTPRKPPGRKQRYLQAPIHALCTSAGSSQAAQQTPTFTAHLALCHHRLLVGLKTQHKPPRTRASPGLHSARHKHFMGISGVSNPSCSAGSVRSLLSTHTATSRQGLGGH